MCAANMPGSPAAANRIEIACRLAGAALAVLMPGEMTAQDLLVRAGTLVVAPDTVLSGGAMLVRDGKIAYVGRDIPAETQERARLVDYGPAWITPGFVLAQSTLGRDADLAETALPFTPDLLAAEAFDPWAEPLLALPRHGITAVAWSPAPRNVAAGLAALVKPGREQGRIAAAELHLVLALTPEARNPERPPTSLMGARELLREAFATAQRGVAIGPDTAILRQVLAGSRRVAVHADSLAELTAALDLAGNYGFQPVLIGAAEAGKLLDRLAARGAAIVLPTLRPDDRLETLRLPAKLAEVPIPFAFGGAPEQLRLSAALAVRHGLGRTAALRALTRGPALLLGQDGAIGSLRQGAAADFLVFDGDPLDLTSAHLATWIDGARVHGDEPARRTPPTTTATSAAGSR